MPDRKPKPDRVTPHKDKLCQTCGRAFSWRKKWERDCDASQSDTVFALLRLCLVPHMA